MIIGCSTPVHKAIFKEKPLYNVDKFEAIVESLTETRELLMKKYLMQKMGDLETTGWVLTYVRMLFYQR